MHFIQGLDLCVTTLVAFLELFILRLKDCVLIPDLIMLLLQHLDQLVLSLILGQRHLAFGRHYLSNLLLFLYLNLNL